jgi:hypothetical protein
MIWKEGLNLQQALTATVGSRCVVVKRLDMCRNFGY